jgi:hypothetical protein
MRSAESEVHDLLASSNIQGRQRVAHFTGLVAVRECRDIAVTGAPKPVAAPALDLVGCEQRARVIGQAEEQTLGPYACA